ncbi:MAG: molybdopterin converting factor subunit 1 [Thermoplasmata archaeon]
MRFHVRLFASLREEVGQETVKLELGNPATVADLLRAFSDDYPHARSVGQAIVAVNQEVAGREATVHVEDEIAFLPPVSGGVGCNGL